MKLKGALTETGTVAILLVCALQLPVEYQYLILATLTSAEDRRRTSSPFGTPARLPQYSLVEETVTIYMSKPPSGFLDDTDEKSTSKLPPNGTLDHISPSGIQETGRIQSNNASRRICVAHTCC